LSLRIAKILMQGEWQGADNVIALSCGGGRDWSLANKPRRPEE